MQESLRGRRKAPPASLNVKNTAQFYPAWTVVKNRQSSTTAFDDTDFEFSDSDEESPRMSMGSFGHDSNSSLSTPELPTPDNAPRAPFNFKFDKWDDNASVVTGPSGPHLFRSSVVSTGSVPSTEIDLYFERSPVQSQFRSDSETPNSRSEFTNSETNTPYNRSEFIHSDSETPNSRSEFAHSDSETPNSRSEFIHSASETPSSRSEFPRSESEARSIRYQFSPRTPKAYSTLHPDVSQVEESEIRAWTPSQVAHWMHIAGYDGSMIEQFLINDINGSVLLNLRIDDLKELGIQSFGKRHQLMASIDHLRNTMLKSPVPQEDPIERRRSYTMSVSPTGEVLSKLDGNQITAAEAVSIVGIEQVLPKPHNCSKGEDCPKFRRRQRQLEKLAAEFPDAIFLPGGSILTGNPGNPESAKNMLRPKSDAEPSVIASSDIFGPSQSTPRLSQEALSEVSKLDPQESVRNFLTYQHVDHAAPSNHTPIPEPATSAMPPAPAAPALSPRTTNLRSLPKLMIPTDSDSDDLTTATTMTAQRTITPTRANQLYGSPTAIQQYGPFTSSAQYMLSDVHYRQGTPFSEMDVPVTAIPDGPIARDTSQSVPPDMQYGNLMQLRRQEPLMRSSSIRPKAATPLRRVHEGRPLTPIEDPSDLKKRSPRIGFNNNSTSSNSALAADPEVTRSGWMKKRKPARFLRHDWQDAHFTLRGTNLAMHKDELAALRHSQALEMIDVDDYAVACSSLATSSKLSAAFKRSVLRSGHNLSNDEAAFAFSLVPATKENEKKALFGNSHIKSHHFAVKTRDERIDWMRELMLSKALKKGKEGGSEMQVNGNFI